jgi:hypothetical protein
MRTVLDPGDKASLDAILTSYPEQADLAAHVRAFAALRTGRRGEAGRGWWWSGLAR